MCLSKKMFGSTLKIKKNRRVLITRRPIEKEYDDLEKHAHALLDRFDELFVSSVGDETLPEDKYPREYKELQKAHDLVKEGIILALQTGIRAIMEEY